MSELRDAYVAAIDAENEMLRERIAALEAQLGMTVEVPLSLGLTAAETKLFGYFLKRDLVTKDGALVVMYGHRPADEMAEEKIIDVFVCKMRRKLTPFGIAIETIWGRGYRMPPESKARAREFLLHESAA